MVIKLNFCSVCFEVAEVLFVEIVTLADVDTEDHVGNSLLIWELEFVQHFAADVL